MNQIIFLFTVVFLFSACNSSKQKIEKEPAKIKILIDADANNELDDQHALAYAFLNSEVFDIVGITVNNTFNGEGIQGHYDEALRIIRLLNLENKMPLKKGATGTFEEIAPTISDPNFDGAEAVDFIIEEALKMKDEKLVLLPIGKLTNVTLAILKEPKIIEKIRVVWLGSNYPRPGEYNLENDITSVNPVIESGVEFEMVTVRYSDNTGTTAVKVTREEIAQNVKGKGPKANTPITGRHGGEFSTFGDYSYNLFEHAEMHGNPPTRSLFDMAAVAIVKNPNWAEKVEIPAPKLVGKAWEDQPNNRNTIYIWENFNRDAIVNDFYEALVKSY
ncbi:MAG: nucleoside hydrolase [Bacteroidetes bacterium]|nr:nucleoside hydrolase [Bacteroidota bacterium]